MKFQLVEIKTSFTMRFVVCTYIEMLSTQKQGNMTKLQVNQDILYFEIISKPNLDSLGITVYM